MREACEYAVGIFHESIMAIQSGGWAEGRKRDLSFRCDANRRGCGLSGLPLSDVLHPSRWNPRCFLSVSGQLAGGEHERDAHEEQKIKLEEKGYELVDPSGDSLSA